VNAPGAGAADGGVGRNPPDQARLGQLAEEQAALRRVATLVARGAAPEEVFTAVAGEVGQLLRVELATLIRYEPGRTATPVTTWGPAGEDLAVGIRWPLEGHNVSTLVFETGRPARIDRYPDSSSGRFSAGPRESGIRSAVGTPVLVEGSLWGAIFAGSTMEQPLPPDTETRLASFTELVATAIANTESRAALARLAQEQAALRRVATLVARGAAPEEVFTAVAGEVGQLLPVDQAALCRYEPDGALTFVSQWGRVTARFPVGSRWKLGGRNVGTLVFQTGRPARVDYDAESSSGPLGAGIRDAGLRSAIGTPIIVEGRLWGTISVASQREQPLPADTEARLVSFTELVATAIANTESRTGLARLAEEQAALRRVAMLVARATPPQQVFAAVAEEVGGLLEVDYTVLIRSDPEDMITVVGGWTAAGVALPSPAGSRFEVGGRNVSTLTLRTGRPARLDAYVDVTGSIGDTGAHDWGFRSSVGVPISVEGRPWGLILVAYTRDQQLPADTEARLASFTELVATAIANTESRVALARLAEEQAALRRVATLVARGVPQEEVFAAVTEEVGRLFLAYYAGMYRYESDGMLAFVASWGGAELDQRTLHVGSRWKLGGHNLGTLVFETGRPTRIDGYADASGPLGTAVREAGIRSTVGAPITVEGRLWGLIGIGANREQSLALDTDEHLASFTELVATAIANAESRSELAASRRRIVAASDQARRRIERDLHDGTQQRLVSLGLAVRAAEADVAAGRGDPRVHLARIVAGLGDTVAELQDFSRGIHPAILSERGLGPALRALARRSAVPVELDVTTHARCPEPVEIAAYYVASEALANAMKHAQASHVEMSLAVRGGSLLLSVRDDGVGGADPAQGSGLAGLTDRVEALGGSIHVHSVAGAGTHITVDLPLEYEPAQGAG
jgi:GAF domain-containing protein